VSNFRRGFKSWCESTSLQYRTVLGLEAAAPLPARKLAAHIGVRVLGIEEVPGLPQKALAQLTKRDPESWSGLLVAHRGINLVVINTTHSDGRKSSSLMHECSHVILNHKPAQALQSPGGILISSYDRQQEDEADWLAGTLLLPRVALLKIAQQGVNYSEHTREYVVSDDMLRMRLDRTGVSIQMRRRVG
jgi:Zn-dependent peptidase ImmA (M78 family)